MLKCIATHQFECFFTCAKWTLLLHACLRATLLKYFFFSLSPPPPLFLSLSLSLSLSVSIITHSLFSLSKILSLSLYLSLSSGGSRIQVTGGHKTKPAGGVGGGCKPPSGVRGSTPKNFEFKCFQTVKSPISTPSAGDKNVLQAIVRLQNVALLYMYIIFEDMVLWDAEVDLDLDLEKICMIEISMIMRYLWLRYVWSWDIYDWNMYDWNMWLRWLKYVIEICVIEICMIEICMIMRQLNLCRSQSERFLVRVRLLFLPKTK